MTRIPQDSLQAIGLMMIAVFMMSTMDVAFKMLVEHYGSFQVVFYRCAVSLPLFLAWILATDPSQFRTYYPVGHLVRGVIGIAMLYTVGECFREMHLTDAYALFFSAPLLITLLSGPVLGEPAGTWRTLAAAVGFVGVLVLLSPGGAGAGGDAWISYGAVMGLLAVVFYAASILLVRRMGARDGTVTIAFWFVLLVGLGSGLLAIPSWRPLEREHWLTVAVLGVSGGFGQALFTAAYRRASAAVVAPYDYTHMIWAVCFGYLFWGYLPGLQTWIGAAIVIASGLFIFYREYRLQQRARAALESP